MKFFSSLLILSLTISAAYSQTVQVQAIGEVEMKDANGKVSSAKQAIESATLMAQLKGVEAVISRSSDTIRQQYAETVGDLEERKKVLRQLVTDKTIQTEPRTKLATPRMRVYLRGKLDMTALKDQLNSWSKTVSKVDYSETTMVLFFTVRKTTETRADEGGVVIEREKSGNTEESGSEEITESGVKVTERSNERDSLKRSVSSVKKADVNIYQIDNNFNNAWEKDLLDRFTAKGFEDVWKGSQFSVAASIAQDLVTTGGMGPETSKRIITELRDEEEYEAGTFFIIGSLDFTNPTRDSVSGMWSVDAKMTGEVNEIPSKRTRYKSIAALGTIVRTGLGKTQQIAKQNALNTVASLGVDEIIAKLKIKGKL